MSSKKVLLTLAALVLVIAAMAGGYYFLHRYRPLEKPAVTAGQGQSTSPEPEDISSFRIYYPVDSRLQVIERRVHRKSKQTAAAESVMEEFFKGPGGGAPSAVPQNVKVLGVYRDAAQILYVDLSDELRRNFQGDALAEYLVLQGIFESLMANIQEVRDVKVLVEGKEIESMGGHFHLKFPLKGVVSSELKAEEKVSRE
ncbi:MAG: GerMN domain-containing protein [Nitrospiraceae bacterium]|nr:GerMN domain-containing protein [Nitrospiraceae bacterium]